jgi:hypothetical protein
MDMGPPIMAIIGPDCIIIIPEGPIIMDPIGAVGAVGAATAQHSKIETDCLNWVHSLVLRKRMTSIAFAVSHVKKAGNNGDGTCMFPIVLTCDASANEMGMASPTDARHYLQFRWIKSVSAYTT